jgi:septal ring factor EnvC (AmiA/AmiB activator)
MAYRGGDLELRTPQELMASRSEAHAAANGWTAEARFRNQTEDQDLPIWVDDVVMECFNLAYDLALAHRAAEVRLEHLLHALTIVDGAVRILDGVGVRTLQLRRDSGSRLVAEPPSSSAMAQPRRSQHLLDTLRRASEHAYSRRRPVSVVDLVSVLLQSPTDWPGTDLVRRHAGGWSLKEADARERVRVAAITQHAAEPGPFPFGFLDEASIQRGWTQLTERLTAIERALAGIADSNSSRLQALDSLERRLEDFERALTASGERLKEIERALQTRSASDSSGMAAIADSLRSLEQVVREARAHTDLTSIETRLSELNGRSADTEQRLASMGQRLHDMAAETGALNAASDKLRTEVSELSAALERHPGVIAGLTTERVAERIASLVPQAALAEGIEKLDQARSVLADIDGQLARSRADLSRDIGQFHEDLVKINVNQQTIASAMDQWRLDTSADLGSLEERLDELERASARLARDQELILSAAQELVRHSNRWKQRRQRLSQALPTLGGALRVRAPVPGSKRDIPSAGTDTPKSPSRMKPWVQARLTRLLQKIRSKQPKPQAG